MSLHDPLRARERIFGREAGDVVRSEFGAGTQEVSPIDPAGMGVSDDICRSNRADCLGERLQDAVHNRGSSAASWILGMMRPSGSRSAGMSILNVQGFVLRNPARRDGQAPPPYYLWARGPCPVRTLFIHLDDRNQMSTDSFIWMIAK